MRRMFFLSLLILICFNFSVYADSTKPDKILAVNEFTVNRSNSGFNFTTSDKTIYVSYGSKIVDITYNGNTKQYYFDDSFTVSGDKVILSVGQYDLIVDNIESSKARRIRAGKAISMPQSMSYANIYADENLSKYMTRVPVSTNMRVINSVLDGKLKVLTVDGKEGFMDTRAINILGDSIPPNIREINFNTSYIILVSQDKQNVKVYLKNNSGNYDLIKQSVITTGKVSTPTPNGIFTIKERGPYFSTNSYGGRAYNYVQFRGNHLFHSVLYSSPSTLDQVALKKLGTKDSEGCIRLPVDVAKWFYQYISKGSLVIIDNVEIDINKIIRNKNV